MVTFPLTATTSLMKPNQFLCLSMHISMNTHIYKCNCEQEPCIWMHKGNLNVKFHTYVIFVRNINEWWPPLCNLACWKCLQCWLHNSTIDTATYALLHNVLSSLDNKNLVGGLFCDLQKVFDCINHEILLAKMEFYGISGIANKLMRSYLENIYQRISMKDSKFNKLYSTWEHVKHGVPQGSVLGPLLFLIYINDLSLTMNKSGNSILFADDTSIIISDTNPLDFKSNINQTMTEIINWFQSNLLTLNCDKTQFLQFLTKKQNEIPIKIFASHSIITNTNSTNF